MAVNLTKYELNIFIMKYNKKHYPLKLPTHALQGYKNNANRQRIRNTTLPYYS